MEEKAVIYGVKSGETYHYIGKTIVTNADGEVSPSRCQTQYLKPELRKVFLENEIEIEQLQVIPQEEWWDEKLSEVVEKHAEHHPLHNAQWMKDGKRGICWWEGKKRDPHTLQRLSESKYKRCVQYNSDGELVKVWDSCKQAGIEVFDDYRIINGSAESRIYKLTKAYTIKGRFGKGSYWFTDEQLIKHFNTVPSKINIPAIRAREKERVSAAITKAMAARTHSSQFQVLQYNLKGTLLHTFPNAEAAAKKLGVGPNRVRKICRGKIPKNPLYYLVYGEKTSQPIVKSIF